MTLVRPRVVYQTSHPRMSYLHTIVASLRSQLSLHHNLHITLVRPRVVYQTSHPCMSYLHTTVASLRSQLSSHTVPHSPCHLISTRPSFGRGPSTKRTGKCVISREKHKYRNSHLHILKCLPSWYKDSNLTLFKPFIYSRLLELWSDSCGRAVRHCAYIPRPLHWQKGLTDAHYWICTGNKRFLLNLLMKSTTMGTFIVRRKCEIS